MLSRFHLVPERNGQTDGRTDRFAISISRVSMLTRDKNHTNQRKCFKDVSKARWPPVWSTLYKAHISTAL